MFEEKIENKHPVKTGKRGKRKKLYEVRHFYLSYNAWNTHLSGWLFICRGGENFLCSNHFDITNLQLHEANNERKNVCFIGNEICHSNYHFHN